MTELQAKFWCTACGEPVDLTAAGFLGNGPLPKCPCQDVIECEDCGTTFPQDMAGELAWVDHVLDKHPDA